MMPNITGRTRKTILGMTATIAIALGASLTSPVHAESTWDTIQSQKVLRVGVAQAEPWFYKDPASGQWTGIGPSYADALTKLMNVKLQLVEVTWGTAIAALQANKIDMMPLLNATPQRALSIDYANAPLAYSGLALLVKDGLTVKVWDDANKPELTIAVPHGAAEDEFVTNYLQKAKVLRFPSYADQISAFQSGNADAVLLYHPTLAVLAPKVGKGQIVIPTPYHVDASDVAVRRENDKTFRDFLGVADNYFYNTGRSEQWYEQYLKDHGVKVGSVPGIQRESWVAPR